MNNPTPSPTPPVAGTPLDQVIEATLKHVATDPTTTHDFAPAADPAVEAGLNLFSDTPLTNAEIKQPLYEPPYVSYGFACDLERKLAPLVAEKDAEIARLLAALIDANKRDGSWLDELGACRVCGGEIPYGHEKNCDRYKDERTIEELRRENAALKARSDSYANELRKSVTLLTACGFHEEATRAKEFFEQHAARAQEDRK